MAYTEDELKNMGLTEDEIQETLAGQNEEAAAAQTPAAGQEAAPPAAQTPAAGQEAAPPAGQTPAAGQEAAPPAAQTPAAGQEAAPPVGQTPPAGQEAAPPAAQTAPAGQEAAPPAGQTPAAGQTITPAKEDENEVQLKALRAQRAELAKKLDNGELTAEEWNAANEEVEDKAQDIQQKIIERRVEENIRARDSEAAWTKTCSDFLAGKPDYKPGSLKFDALNQAVMLEQQKAQAAGKSTKSLEILQAAERALNEAFGVQAAPASGQGADKVQVQPANTRPAPPKTLGGLGASVPTGTGESPFAAVDQILNNPDRDNPEASEEALAKMTPAQRDAFLRGA